MTPTATLIEVYASFDGAPPFTIELPRKRGAATDETERLSRLVNELLQLARTGSTAPAVTVDLGALVRDRIDIWSATAEAVVDTITRVAAITSSIFISFLNFEMTTGFC